jgi:hypothetical protein
MNKEKNSYVTPSNPFREWILRISNDIAWGMRPALWMGKALGGLQLPWKVRAQGKYPGFR